MTLIKVAPLVTVKAGPEDGLEDGQFEAYASIFDNVDAYGDIVRRGAFAETLAEWQASELLLPLLFGHEMFDPDYNIGHVIEAREDERGLWTRCQIDVEAETGKARQVYRLVKGRRIGQMSFAYDVLDSGTVMVNGERVYELRKLKLHEISVVTIGANQETEILAVKHGAARLVHGAKEGRVLAAKHIDSLRSAQEAIGAVIAAAEGTEQGKASGQAGDKNEEPSGVKFEDPRLVPSATLARAGLVAQIQAVI